MMTRERLLSQSVDRARRRQQLLSTGFSRQALELAGITAEFDAAEDALAEHREDEVERPDAHQVNSEDALRRAACPPHLYARIYG